MAKAAGNIYIRWHLVEHVTPYHTLFYQMVFSIPILFLMSFAIRDSKELGGVLGELEQISTPRGRGFSLNPWKGLSNETAMGYELSAFSDQPQKKDYRA